jgi:predicted dinucleotide-binding enzyme
MAGMEVVLGSRQSYRAEAAAKLLGHGIRGSDNAWCAGQADIVIAAVPYDGHADLLAGLATTLAGKILVDCVNPLGFDAQGAYVLEVPEGSAAQQAVTSPGVVAFRSPAQVSGLIMPS